MDNYDQLVEKISLRAEVPRNEIERKIEAKRAKLSGLVSREGAAQIVAAELGINFDQEKMKISELVQGMKRANIVGKVIDISPVRSFNKNGREGKVVNLLIADESSNVKTVLWDVNHISLVENGKIAVGEVVEISNGNVRNGELHLGSFSDIKKSKTEIKEVVSDKVFSGKNLGELKPGQGAKIRAVVVQVFEPRYFEVCPECRKKAVDGNCSIHGKVKAERRALLNLVLDDGSETIRAVVVGTNINSLGLTDEEIFSLENFEAKRDELLGEERVFFGNMRANTLYNTIEFSVERIEEVKVEELVKELESRQ